MGVICVDVAEEAKRVQRVRRGGPAAGGESSCTAWGKEGVRGETHLPHRCLDPGAHF